MNANLVFKSESGKPVTNSLLIAQRFEKRHSDVIRSIESSLEVNAKLRLHCVLASYEDEQRKTHPLYILDRKGFTFIATGFTGAKAAEFKWDFIDAFDNMESLLNSDEYILMRSQEILANRVKALEANIYQQQEIIEHKDKEIEKLLPEAEYTKKVLMSSDTFTTTQIAKELGMGAKTLNKKLQEMRIQYKQNEQWVLYARHQNKGYTKTNTYTEIINDKTRTWHSTVWTEKGRRFILELFQNKATA